MFFSLVLPAYNEAKALPAAVEAARRELRKIKRLRFEIVIAEDGARDDTPEVAAALAKKFKDVRNLHSAERLGRGRALYRAFRAARGDCVGYMDVDLATPARHLKELVACCKEFDVVTGSRYLPSSKTKRSASRGFLSGGFNLLVRLLLGSRLRDHQCGFKAFKRRVALELCGKAKSQHWFWDTEVLVLAQKLGYRVAEFPVEWSEKGAAGRTKVSLRRDVIEMLVSILRMRVALWRGDYFERK